MRCSAQDTLIQGAKVFTPLGWIDEGWVLIREGVIYDMGELADLNGRLKLSSWHGDTVNAAGLILLPGFVDLHVHGGLGFDFLEADEAAVSAITGFHLRRGVTSLFATMAAAPLPKLMAAVRFLRSYQASNPNTNLAGIHLEGPFISPKYSGAQHPNYCIEPSKEVFNELISQGQGIIRIITLAPELPGALELIEMAASFGVLAAGGHSGATYDRAFKAINLGMRHITHVFNAMAPFQHREPGILGAALEGNVSCEVIADGYHVHPGAVRLLYKLKGVDMVAAVTDAAPVAGLADGDYTWGDRPVKLCKGRVTLKADQTLAGSSITLDQALRWLVLEAGIPLESAIKMVTTTPATIGGMQCKKGSIAVGKDADLVLVTPSLEVRSVWIRGDRVL